MQNTFDVQKNENDELPVPNSWRTKLSEIVSSLADKSLFHSNEIIDLAPIDPAELRRIERNIEDYGDPLLHLSEESWKTSIYRWMGTHWTVLVDLSTTEEPSSDLVLFLTVHAKGDGYKFMIDSVHVP